jgi:myosin heavy subunit
VFACVDTCCVIAQLLEGASAEWKKSMFLGPATDFRYLTQSGCTSVPGVSDKDEFNVLVDALNTYQIDKDDQVRACVRACARAPCTHSRCAL